jgi:hypothetical protein
LDEHRCLVIDGEYGEADDVGAPRGIGVASSHRRIVVGIDDSRDSTRAIGPCLHNYGRRGSGQASVVLDS